MKLKLVTYYRTWPITRIIKAVRNNTKYTSTRAKYEIENENEK
jgi:hypothetical protein